MQQFGVDDYEAYWKTRPLDEAVRVRDRELMLLKRLVKPGGRILELGPGGGQVFWAMNKSGYEMYAIDIAQTVIEHLKAPEGRAKRANLNEGVPDFGVKFDAILGVMVLHHIIEPLELLKTLREKLNPGGHLVLTVPNIITLKNRLRLLMGRFPKLSPSHRNFMTPHEVCALFKQAGFRVDLVTSSRDKALKKVAPILFSRELILAAQAPA